MAQVQGIPYRRHGPSAALQEFLDPLDPGDYFDCGRARLHGLDDALLDEARSRGREVGDDDFLLVATDAGLFFCRPSISFAISARWDEITLIRPRGDDPVLLPITWPRHGELKFTVSKRLAGNIFRRWLQLRMHADRKKRETGQHSIVSPVARRLEVDLDLDIDADIDAEGDIDADGDPGVPGEGEPVGIDDLLLGDDVETDPPFPPRIDDEAASPKRGGPDREGPDDRVDTVDPRPAPAETSDGLPFLEPVGANAATGALVDEQLERVTVPRTTKARSSWVGSAVSLVASLVVISTVVLIASVSVSVWRGVSGSPSIAITAGEGEEATAASPTTIDHERYRSSSDPVDQTDTGPADETAGLAPSSAGGASQSIPSSSQQLLAVSTDGPVGSPESETGSESATDPDAALRCSSNYSGCIPDVDDTAGADVDCLGQGDGPFFAETEVMVLGDDVYGLDSDGDRVACEADQMDQGPLSTGAPVGTAGG